MLTCPICQQALTLTAKTYRCPASHSFDVAKEGYVNLHVVQHKKSKNPGDTPESVRARRRFLSAGFYAPLRQAIVEQVAGLSANRVLDIGCGEGYYTQALADATKQVVALDIAKSAVQIAAKADKQHRITWVVGTGAILPVADGSMDLCTSFFSPLPKGEMLRVLAPGGFLMVATPAPRHLYAMRQALFDQVIEHEPQKFIASLAPDFKLVDEILVHHAFELDKQALKDLVAMTPYAFKARAANRLALENLDKFHVQAEFCLYIFKKS